MNAREFLVTAVFTVPLLSALPFTPARAQSAGIGSSQLVWENDRIRVERISLAPGERLTGDSRSGSVIVFLTADLDGRMPPAEAAWRDPGVVTMENRGRARFEALVIDLKSNAPVAPGVTAPEVVRAAGTVTQTAAYRDTYRMMVDARTLIRNEHLSVTKQRYGPGSSGYFEPLHFHPQDAVVIYLRGGYTWPATSHSGPDLVRRGDVRVVPANAVHLTGNAGSDFLELLLIIPS